MAKDRHGNELMCGDLVTRTGDDGKPVEGMVNWIGTEGAEQNIKVGVGESESSSNSKDWEISKPEVQRQLRGPSNAAWRKAAAAAPAGA